MTSVSPRTALIAGAGLAGLTAAVLLDELGFQVTLIERKPILGGRTFSYTDRITGQTVDNGQHIMMGAYHHTFKFLEKIGAKHKVEMLKPTVIPLVNKQNKHRAIKIGTARPPLNLIWGLANYKGLSVLDKIRLISLIRPVLSKVEGAISQMKHNHLTVLAWLQQHHQSPNAIQNFWEPLTLATLNDTPDNTTVDGLLQVIQKSYFGGPNDGFLVFPKNGLSEVFAEPARKYLELRGCKIITGAGLNSIDAVDGRVTSFRLNDGTELKADLFVSALPPWDLKHVLTKELLKARPKLAGINEMNGSPVVAVDLFFDRPVMTERFVGLTNTQTHWFFNKGNHIAAVISAAHNLMTQNKQTIVNTVLNDFQHIVHPVHPVHSTVHKIANATLSSRPGINEKRPDQRILDNLFVIGDWTKTNLPATIESAVKSAFMMTASIDQSTPACLGAMER